MQVLTGIFLQSLAILVIIFVYARCAVGFSVG